MTAKVILIVCLTIGLGVGYPCRQNWELFQNTCYGFGETVASWAEAQEMCRVAGAKLAEIETKAENDFLKSQARHRSTYFHYWIGGTDMFHEGTWTWATTGDLIYFTDWRANEPDNYDGDEDCIALWGSYDYQWNDWECPELKNFICEAPVEETVIG